MQQVPAHDPTLDPGKELHATTPEGALRRHYRRRVIRDIQHDFSLVCELSRRVMQDIGGRVLGLYTRMRMSSTTRSRVTNPPPIYIADLLSVNRSLARTPYRARNNALLFVLRNR